MYNCQIFPRRRSFRFVRRKITHSTIQTDASRAFVASSTGLAVRPYRSYNFSCVSYKFCRIWSIFEISGFSRTSNFLLLLLQGGPGGGPSLCMQLMIRAWVLKKLQTVAKPTSCLHCFKFAPRSPGLFAQCSGRRPEKQAFDRYQTRCYWRRKRRVLAALERCYGQFFSSHVAMFSGSAVAFPDFLVRNSKWEKGVSPSYLLLVKSLWPCQIFSREFGDIFDRESPWIFPPATVAAAVPSICITWPLLDRAQLAFNEGAAPCLNFQNSSVELICRRWERLLRFFWRPLQVTTASKITCSHWSARGHGASLGVWREKLQCTRHYTEKDVWWHQMWKKNNLKDKDGLWKPLPWHLNPVNDRANTEVVFRRHTLLQVCVHVFCSYF